jgi:hypothetical protein
VGIRFKAILTRQLDRLFPRVAELVRDCVFYKTESSAGTGLLSPASLTAAVKALIGAYRSGDIDGSSVQVGDERLIIFDDSLNGANGNIICRITGDGEFINNSTDALSWAIVVSRSGSVVSIDAQFIGAGTRGCVRCTGGNTRLHARLITSGGPRAVECYGGTNFVRADELSSSGGNALELGDGTNVIAANRIASTAGVGLRCYGGTNDVTAREVRSSAGYGLHHQFVEDPFTLTVNRARIVSTLAAAGGKAVQVDGSDDLTLKDCVLVSSVPAATSIDAGAAQNVRLYGSTMANKAAGGNVTFLTGGARFEANANVR